MKKNLKIAITPEQPLDEVVRELESKGYVCDGYHLNDCNWVYSVDDGTFAMYGIEFNGDYEETTLTELRSMNTETPKEME